MWMILLTLGCSSPTPPEDGAIAVDPEPVPRELISITAAELAQVLASPADQPRVVNFWATWCAPCIEELPRLREWGRKTDAAELILVDLDLPRLKDSKVVPFIEKYEISEFRNYMVSDKDPATAMTEAVPEFRQSIPFTLLIPTQGGTERTVLMGAVSIPQIEKGLADL